jgi:SAM-dependent methyltransferase
MSRRRREQDLRSYYDAELPTRARRAVDPERAARRDRFMRLLAIERRRTLLEVGCGPGRDGEHFARAGLEYVGVDLAPAAVAYCRRLGLRAEQASVLELPFDDASFDAGWTMSTLLHVADDDLQAALSELARVLAPGAPLVVGLWGGAPREELHNDGTTRRPPRFFAVRSDDGLRHALSTIGSIAAFDTWPHPEPDSGLHYQLAEVRIERRRQGPVDRAARPGVAPGR